MIPTITQKRRAAAGVVGYIYTRTGLVGEWLFNGNANDSYSTHDGTVTGATLTTDRFGNTDSAYDLNGTSDYISVDPHADLSFGDGFSDSAFSILTWVKMDDATRFRIVNKFYSAANQEYILHTSGADKIYFSVYDTTLAGLAVGRYYNTALTSYEGTYICLVGTYDGSGNESGVKIYLQGSRVDDTSASAGAYTAMHTTPQPLEFGRYASTPTYANGVLDDIVLWNRELPSAEVLDIYNGSKP